MVFKTGVLFGSRRPTAGAVIRQDMPGLCRAAQGAVYGRCFPGFK